MRYLAVVLISCDNKNHNFEELIQVFNGTFSPTKLNTFIGLFIQLSGIIMKF
jgi:hypothetical protein